MPIPATYRDTYLSMLIPATYRDTPAYHDMLGYPGPHEHRLSRPRSSADLEYSNDSPCGALVPADAICMMGVDEVFLQDYTPLIPLLILLLIPAYLGTG